MPVIITIDGPSAAGKGTLSKQLAKYFNYNYLNSGALYRLVAYTALKNGVDFMDVESIVKIGENISPIFVDNGVIVDGVDIWGELSKEELGRKASLISPYPALRKATYNFQHRVAQASEEFGGLIAEGRDLGVEVFPEATLKIFLDASPAKRAERRLRDEHAKGREITLEELTHEIEQRDYADRNRPVGATRPAENAHIIDTTDHTVQQTFEVVLEIMRKEGLMK
jgi:cytidylate kinase